MIPTFPDRVQAVLAGAVRFGTDLAGVAAVALVGSYARGAAGPASDVDLVVLCDRPEDLLASRAWFGFFDPHAELIRSADFGAVQERRLWLPGGLEVEVGLAAATWAATDPVDPGTRRVVHDGLVVLHDPRGLLRDLLRAVATDAVLTPRLVLTPIGTADVDDLEVLYGDPEIARWTGPWTSDAVRAWVADTAGRWVRDGVGKWTARARSDGTLVGRGGFSRVTLDGEPVLELGWAVRDALTRRGYATELGRAALAWTATHHPDVPVVAYTEVHNHASRAVMERLGLVHTSTIRRPGLVEGRDGIHPDAPFALYRLP